MGKIISKYSTSPNSSLTIVPHEKLNHITYLRTSYRQDLKKKKTKNYNKILVAEQKWISFTSLSTEKFQAIKILPFSKICKKYQYN